MQVYEARAKLKWLEQKDGKILDVCGHPPQNISIPLVQAARSRRGVSRHVPQIPDPLRGGPGVAKAAVSGIFPSLQPTIRHSHEI